MLKLEAQRGNEPQCLFRPGISFKMPDVNAIMAAMARTAARTNSFLCHHGADTRSLQLDCSTAGNTSVLNIESMHFQLTEVTCSFLSALIDIKSKYFGFVKMSCRMK